MVFSVWGASVSEGFATLVVSQFDATECRGGAVTTDFRRNIDFNISNGLDLSRANESVM